MPQQKPRLDLDLSGPVGNIFEVASAAAKLVPDKSQEMAERLLKSGSYALALAVIRDYVDLVDLSGQY